ncbi:hypothetical protein COX86_04055 [Candidatus Micrarchaeota archaeon CG_4_10_14_0_2_um_filter_60_11]|nr:MAG: hypothetical protein AUJ16_01785 [Candidatus Micrarchaeota archaeon CG1_02_60_51]PIN96007.1 MAG: hypothetical protein COU39_03050 [Candidatus Micrarchaeota archaeon CG10_big_fil_rev_8_21_14_0_10_60_32]PIO01558.1 MAG: hypothetical protein COT58_04555 [Candidatus Micrarchaeota archaeon CG09_land_8_20_14_0_10_60_16]PIQ77439.1 MAG: hypothetical protein COV82_04475 [Candidatus Peregrinibacteria bacterium CG11_big_fil_rev_8_21_14_0_20_46_8]PIY91745.1 MAG: hypothetical protein COY71_01485 [Can
MDRLVKPNCSNKTGSWRSSRPVVDEARCIGCATCDRVCPDSAAKVGKDKKAHIDYDYCKGCGVCANECPVKCIAMKPE